MVQGKSNKPDILDGRKNGQSQYTRKTNQMNKEIDKKNKEMNKEIDKKNKELNKKMNKILKY